MPINGFFCICNPFQILETTSYGNRFKTKTKKPERYPGLTDVHVRLNSQCKSYDCGDSETEFFLNENANEINSF
ncbi:MAG: hypothetical protein CMJ82_05425 [Planctomycetaceae bacterium]|nr:hypothetical protein [Planctomycetaceae bacterium]